VKKLQEKIKVLIQLQECDKRIKAIIEKKNEGPAKIKALQGEVEEFQRELEAKKEELEQQKKERRKIEREIDDLELKKQKSHAKLSSISSNKEYRAALKEIDELEREKGLREEKALELMEAIEALEEECKRLEEEYKQLQDKCKKEEKEILEQIQDLDQELERLERQRDGLCNQIDQGLLRHYNNLRGRKGGLAISPVIKGVCQTCHMGIPPQKFNELIRGDDLMSCPNCNRIIYWGDAKHFKELINSAPMDEC